MAHADEGGAPQDGSTAELNSRPSARVRPTSFVVVTKIVVDDPIETPDLTQELAALMPAPVS